MIVVGIDHAGQKRGYEYLPYKDYFFAPTMEEPAGKLLPKFLTDEVMPLVNGQYRTLTGHPNAGIGGSSYGGAAALHALLARPDVFGYGLIESPSLSIGMGQLVRDTSPLVAVPWKVWLAIGDREMAGNRMLQERMIDRVRLVEGSFRAADYDDSSFRLVVDPESKHDESAWAKRFPGAIQFLFGQWQPQKPGAN